MASAAARRVVVVAEEMRKGVMAGCDVHTLRVLGKSLGQILFPLTASRSDILPILFR